MDRTKPNASGSSDHTSNVVDISVARAKTTAGVNDERAKMAKLVIVSALVLTGLTGLSLLDSVHKTPISETKATGNTIVSIVLSPNGHYTAKGKINGKAVNFIVDTGATNVVLPLSVAKNLELPLGRQFSTNTANGQGTAYQTQIDSITLGGITLTGVDAAVTEGIAGDMALLGMSFLNRTRIEQEDGVMKIIY